MDDIAKRKHFEKFNKLQGGYSRFLDFASSYSPTSSLISQDQISFLNSWIKNQVDGVVSSSSSLHRISLNSSSNVEPSLTVVVFEVYIDNRGLSPTHQPISRFGHLSSKYKTGSLVNDPCSFLN